MAIVEIAVRKEHHAEYIRSIFAQGNDPGSIVIRRSHDIGRYIYSQVRHAHLPVVKQHEPGHFIIKCELPHYRQSTDESYFLYFTQEDMHRINDFITSDFNLKYRAFLQAGTDIKLNYQQSTKLFLEQHDINAQKLETLTKRDYRTRDKIMQTVSKLAENAGYL